jgi:hypothetical protein
MLSIIEHYKEKMNKQLEEKVGGEAKYKVEKVLGFVNLSENSKCIPEYILPENFRYHPWHIS